MRSKNVMFNKLLSKPPDFNRLLKLGEFFVHQYLMIQPGLENICIFNK